MRKRQQATPLAESVSSSCYFPTHNSFLSITLAGIVMCFALEKNTFAERDKEDCLLYFSLFFVFKRLLSNAGWFGPV
ncbi:MAG: hypothetical protein K2W82_15620 [Candidatus Obscuribacterales bacterium]|nr:hypothetical protein [Candidatus Obscuribacterales bacterium]